MDLQDLFESQEEWLEIKRPDGSSFIGADGEPFRIKLAGPAHPAAFRAEEAVRLRVLKQMSEKMQPETTVESYIQNVLEPLVTRTLDWTALTHKGAPFACTSENAFTLYRQSDLVRKQVEAFLFRTENFQKTP